MTPSEYQELADFFVERLGRVHEETRTFVHVSVESLRDEIRVVADGVLANGRRIDENTRRLEENGHRIDENTRRIEDNGRRIEDNGHRIDENGRRIEDNGHRIDENGRRIESLGSRIDALTDRVGRLEGTVAAGFAQHEARIRALE